MAQGGGHLNHECENFNITLKTIGSANPLYPYLVDEDREGVLEVHPFSFNDIGGWDSLLVSLSNDPNISYEYVGTKESRLFDGYFFSYQQLYMGIPVENGGFSILLETDDPSSIPGICGNCEPPCGAVAMIAPHIYEAFMPSVPTVPLVAQQAVKNYLSPPANQITVNTSDLRIVNNLKKDCVYKLAWRVDYSYEGRDFIGWVDSQSGELFLEKDKHDNKTAPTQDWGIQDMPDEVDGGEHVLRNDVLRVYDMAAVTSDPNGFPIVTVGQLGG